MVTVDNLLAHKLNSALKLLSLLVKQQNQNIHVWVIMRQLRVEVIMPPLTVVVGPQEVAEG